MAVSVIALLITLLIAFKTMTSHLLERQKEIGTLKALGWTGQDVRHQLTCEGFIQAISGGILGVLLGVLISFGLSVVIGCFCTYFLGRKIEKMKPSDILRQ